MESTQERLLAFVKYTGLSDNQFGIRAGLSNGLLANIIKRGSSFTNDTLEKIMYAFPELNVEWILSGKGKMLSSVEGPQNEYYTKMYNSLKASEPSDIYGTKQKDVSNTVCFLAETDKSDFIAGMSRKKKSSLSKFDLPWLEEGLFWAIRVDGDSMQPTLANGDYVIVKELGGHNEVRNGEIYVMRTDKTLLIKRVYKQGDSKIVLASDNPIYKSDEIDSSFIISFYIVKERITRNMSSQDDKQRELIALYKQLLLAKGVDIGSAI